MTETVEYIGIPRVVNPPFNRDGVAGMARAISAAFHKGKWIVTISPAIPEQTSVISGDEVNRGALSKRTEFHNGGPAESAFHHVKLLGLKALRHLGRTKIPRSHYRIYWRSQKRSGLV